MEANKSCIQIWEWVKMKLFHCNRSLAPALGILQPEFTDRTDTIGADGKRVYFNVAWMKQQFADDSLRLCVICLHVIGHCLLGHPYLFRRDWDNPECMEQCETETTELLSRLLPKRISAAVIRENAGIDDHSFWDPFAHPTRHTTGSSGPGSRGASEGEEKMWQRAAEAVRREAGWSNRRGTSQKPVVHSLRLTGERRYDYRRFLQQFAVLREEGGPDPEQFDTGLYTWGREQYGNVCLIEPLEYRERRKIEELVIVIDTSGSCNEEMLRVFLEETRNILKEDRLFFRRFRLHILQCDNRIRRDDAICSQEELDRYLERITVTGGGGTDFRPAFLYIEKLRERELHRLGGVIFFSDGCGLFPREMPDYLTAFVFLDGKYDAIDVPDWVLRLVLAVDT